MNTRLLSLIAALALSLSGGAMAQNVSDSIAVNPATPSAAADAVGHWLYDSQGKLIGSVRGFSDSGRSATLIVGFYFQPGVHEAQVPSRTLSIINGKVTLDSETAQALNIRSRG